MHANGWELTDGVLSLLPTLACLADLNDPVEVANLFHGSLISALSEWVISQCRDMGINMVVLSGGCFLNQILAEGLIRNLRQAGIKAMLPRKLPPNDGGLSLGQAWITGISQCV